MRESSREAETCCPPRTMLLLQSAEQRHIQIIAVKTNPGYQGNPGHEGSRANFNLPEHFVDEPTTFGRILSAQAPRQLQLTARLGF